MSEYEAIHIYGHGEIGSGIDHQDRPPEAGMPIHGRPHRLEASLSIIFTKCTYSVRVRSSNEPVVLQTRKSGFESSNELQSGRESEIRKTKMLHKSLPH